MFSTGLNRTYNINGWQKIKKPAAGVPATGKKVNIRNM
jgi:hypothetical protein